MQPQLHRSLDLMRVVAFAVTAEVGAGIFYIATQVQATVPGIGDWVPFVMFLGGIVLFLHVLLYQYFTRSGLVGAGGLYLMLSRSLGPGVGFVLAFVGWFTTSAVLGLLARISAIYLGQALLVAGMSAAGHWMLSPTGGLVVGLLVVWLFWLLHILGVRLAGAFALITLGLVIVVSLLVVGYALANGPTALEASLHQATGLTAASILAHAPPVHLPVGSLIVQALPILYFGYLGATVALQAGGETVNAEATVARAVMWACATVTAIYTLLSWAVYHAVPPDLVRGLAALHKTELTTVPGLIGLLMPHWLDATVAVLVAFLLMKSINGVYLSHSRWTYAWAEDGLIPRGFVKTSRFGAPHWAITMTALLGSVNVIEMVRFGYVFGVSARVLSQMLVYVALGVGLLLFPVLRPQLYRENRSWLARRRGTQWFLSVINMIIGLALAYVLVQSGSSAPPLFQPVIQMLIVAAVGTLIYWGWNRRTLPVPRSQSDAYFSRPPASSMEEPAEFRDQPQTQP